MNAFTRALQGRDDLLFNLFTPFVPPPDLAGVERELKANKYFRDNPQFVPSADANMRAVAGLASEAFSPRVTAGGYMSQIQDELAKKRLSQEAIQREADAIAAQASRPTIALSPAASSSIALDQSGMRTLSPTKSEDRSLARNAMTVAREAYPMSPTVAQTFLDTPAIMGFGAGGGAAAQRQQTLSQFDPVGVGVNGLEDVVTVPDGSGYMVMDRSAPVEPSTYRTLMPAAPSRPAVATRSLSQAYPSYPAAAAGDNTPTLSFYSTVDTSPMTPDDLLRMAQRAEFDTRNAIDSGQFQEAQLFADQANRLRGSYLQSQGLGIQSRQLADQLALGQMQDATNRYEADQRLAGDQLQADASLGRVLAKNGRIGVVDPLTVAPQGTIDLAKAMIQDRAPGLSEEQMNELIYGGFEFSDPTKPRWDWTNYRATLDSQLPDPVDKKIEEAQKFLKDFEFTSDPNIRAQWQAVSAALPALYAARAEKEQQFQMLAGQQKMGRHSQLEDKFLRDAMDADGMSQMRQQNSLPYAP